MVPEFLQRLLEARSPSGYEAEAQSALDAHIKPLAPVYQRDALGNRMAQLNPSGRPSLMLAGHMDELGFAITHIDKDGFLFFDTIGGHDRGIISGRQVVILNSSGVVRGVTGKRAIHLMDEEARKQVPKQHQLWIDIGARSRQEALEKVQIGDPVVYDQSFQLLSGGLLSGRALDNKAGCFVVFEAFKRLAQQPEGLEAQVTAVATTQEEVGTRGAMVSSFALQPQLALVLDVGHATDHPECEVRKYGEFKLGAGPILTRGPNVNPFVLARLQECAKKEGIPYQMEADTRPTGTDARVIQVMGSGVATGLISIPLRYMHTPCEVVQLSDIEHAVALVVAFARSLKPGECGHF